MKMDFSDLDADSKTVLKVVAAQDMDGYTLRAKSGLTDAQLQKAIDTLCRGDFLTVKGQPHGAGLLKAWYQASPRAAFLLQSFA